MLSVDRLTAGYGDLTVLRGVSFALPAASIGALIGANGAGKTTLLRALSGRIPLVAGSVRIEGDEIGRMPAHRRAEAGLCHVTEGGGVFRTLTVEENLRLFADDAEARAAAQALFPRLADRGAQVAGTLSGGEQQMLALMRALATRPRVLLIDELSFGLAGALLDEILPVIAGLPDRGITVLVVEQHLDIALALAGTAVLLQRGEVVFAGPTGGLGRDTIDSCLLGTLPAGHTT